MGVRPLSAGGGRASEKDGAFRLRPGRSSDPIGRGCVIPEYGFTPGQVVVAEFLARVVRRALQRILYEIDDVTAGRGVIVEHRPRQRMKLFSDAEPAAERH